MSLPSSSVMIRLVRNSDLWSKPAIRCLNLNQVHHDSPNCNSKAPLSFQTSFASFEQMIQKCRTQSRDSLLLALDPKEHPLSAKELGDQLRSNVSYREYFRSREKRLCLVHLDQFQPQQIAQSKLVANSSNTSQHTFPLKTRVFQRYGKSNSQTKSMSIKDVQKYFYGLKEERSDDRTLTQLSRLTNHHDQIRLLTDRLLMNELELRLRFFLINQLEEILCRGVFEQFEILPFGSSVNGFGSRSSDLDLVIVPRQANDGQNDSSPKLPSQWQPFCRRIENDRYVTQLCISILHEQIQLIPGTVSVQKIPMARVPIVKFTSNLTDIDVDISIQFHRELGAWNIAHVFFECARICPSLLQLVTFIREWAKVKQLTNKVPGPWITNFSLIMLLVSFLQNRKQPLLPPIKHMGILPDTCKENLNEYLKANQETEFGYLLGEFFLHLSKFDFDSYGFNVFDGACVVKPDFSAMHVQNPLERELNITKNVAKRNLDQLIANAQDAYRIIASNPSLNLASLLSTRNGQALLKDRKPVKVRDLFEMN